VLRQTAAAVEARYPRATIDVRIQESYRNMRYAIEQRPEVVDYADEAMVRAGLTPKRLSIRGGTDGSRLSLLGLLTPNLFAGGMNFHGKKEWVPLEWMEKSVETILHLLGIWVEKAATEPQNVK
jgi:tripeptide aminopeptidase